MTTNAKDRLLKQRARRLAQKPSLLKEIKDARNIMLFSLNQERYAMDVHHVKAILPFNGATPIPGVPSVIAGVINFSGVIYTLLDLNKIFNLESTKNSGKYVIVIEHEKLKICFLIDQVMDYQIISEKEIQTNLTGIQGKQKGYIQGLLKNSTVLINVQNILNNTELFFNP